MSQARLISFDVWAAVSRPTTPSSKVTATLGFSIKNARKSILVGRARMGRAGNSSRSVFV